MSEIKATWVGPGLRLLGEANAGPAVVMDSGHPPYGTQTGASPMELVLLGLAGCTSMDVLSILAKKREPVTGYQIHVTAERADTHPKVYTKIHLEYVFYGKGVRAKSVERAIELSEKTYCGASAMLSKTAEVTHSYRIVEEEVRPHQPGAIKSA
ncbi:MAG TPA: OsmC family protein [Thermoflexia bacterium]|nr:OsmC family protein [Thermoflexia bacterium]